MDRTVVLITGCSSGIGLHLALRLASDPSHSFKVCNAGRGLLGPLEEHLEDDVGSVLDVNVVGTVRMLQAFLPDMKRRRSGRVLVTGSMGGLMGLPFNAVYCASKFAIEGLCESLAVLLLPFGVHLSLIECGPVRTAFQEKVQPRPGMALDGVDTQTRDLFSRFQRHFEQVFCKAAQDPEDVTEVFLTALRAPRPALRYFSSDRLLPLVQLRLADPSGCSYVAAMHRAVFSDEPAESLDSAQKESGSGELAGPELDTPPAAPQ
ncbi:estradiol 17-beta-dehydrogenase 1 isoform X2 [Rousettus aegyptiacus]|uniref:estradiol 17-beta-dehydrogenase 1 isoform X2 n=1 Tax=Rousettus aegyptiacus TaxID=9407 RepID=UPI00078774A1|nr:estradiol 17-beta-dehydrogenase 1 isoform X2 [Rousettus aegyptiacus]